MPPLEVWGLRKRCGLFTLDARFFFTIGSFLLAVELPCLQLCFLALLLAIGAFLLTVGAFLLAIEALVLSVGKCV